jgi:hypothetical protein
VNDKADSSGTATLRYQQPPAPHRPRPDPQGPARALLVADRDIRVLSVESENLRLLTLDSSSEYQPLRRRLVSTMP